MLYLLGNGSKTEGMEFLTGDASASVVLFQDGIYLKCDSLEGREIYAVRDDVDSRGMECILPGWIRRISYEELVLLIENHSVISFI